MIRTTCWLRRVSKRWRKWIQVRPISPDLPPVDLVDIDSDSIIAEASERNNYPDADVIILTESVQP